MATQSDKPIVLYTQSTPNGYPISVFLEELKEKYGGPDYEPVNMSIRDADIGKVHNQVKSPWFLEQINPNGRIPAITHNGFPVFETSAILAYLGQTFDKEHAFSRDPVSDPQGYSTELQWLFFTHGGIGPMQGQANHFNLYAPEKIPYAINRYLNETKRLYGVLESRLTGREWLLDTGYGIADIKGWSWVRFAPLVGLDLAEFPNVKAWIDRIEQRPAVQKGIQIPTPRDPPAQKK
ncbi:glutathione S- transferase, nitrogen catabolite repression regulator [Steccherinum ochraceum]|uniref:Glutathione S-transferase, nitrogen catabolite repression regulator n=1 Tax=Steccherinum ochraceum TaxID=92696 RepID=A0A4R0R5J4_9APHY|nr:glutathione S- transferase, nitrogen catabolite repression regulator [Steccherinum ochraceum]